MSCLWKSSLPWGPLASLINQEGEALLPFFLLPVAGLHFHVFLAHGVPITDQLPNGVIVDLTLPPRRLQQRTKGPQQGCLQLSSSSLQRCPQGKPLEIQRRRAAKDCNRLSCSRQKQQASSPWLLVKRDVEQPWESRGHTWRKRRKGSCGALAL